MSNRTFTIIKPEIVKAGLSGKVLSDIMEGGFRIVALKMLWMNDKQAKSFYDVHVGKGFFDGLISYITSGPVFVAVLEKHDAVHSFRKLIGSTDPKNADEGTIRKKYGTNVENNAVHGSDSDENAVFETSCFFSLSEIYDY